jgi:hypothetical protein
MRLPFSDTFYCLKLFSGNYLVPSATEGRDAVMRDNIVEMVGQKAFYDNSWRLE